MAVTADGDSGREAVVWWQALPEQFFSSFACVGSKELPGDPLMLTSGSQLALQQNADRMVLRDGWLTVEGRRKRGRALIFFARRASEQRFQHY